MSMSSMERNIRFSNLLPKDYNIMRNHYETKLLESLHHNTAFISICESKGAKLKSKDQLIVDARKLTHDSDPAVVKVGKAALKVLLEGGKWFIDFCIVVAGVIIFIPPTMTYIASLFVGLGAFVLISVPAGIVKKGIEQIELALGLIEKKDKNVMKIDKVVREINKQLQSTKTTKPSDLEKLAKVSESLMDVIEAPEIVSEGYNNNEEFLAATESIRMLELLDSKQFSKGIINPVRLALFENLSPDYLSCNTVSITESVMDDTEMFMTLENITKMPLLSGKGLVHGIISIVTETCSEQSIYEFLNRYKKTLEYEMVHENYKDLPILYETGYALNLVRENANDVPDVVESCNMIHQLFKEIVTECETSISEDACQFNPDPFSIGSLTPLPVASRTVGGILCDIEEAETDEEIAEAMIQFGRVMNVIQENYYVDVTESGEPFIVVSEGKVARKAETKANKTFSKVATNDKSKGIKASIKHTIDPMEKFVNAQYKKIKDADTNERREVIMKGGAIPKVMRWIKRGIGLVIGSAVGSIFAPAALITGITFIGFVASDKYLDKKERAKIMKELDDEIMICNEKIDDSRGDDNKKKKYELMRIRNNLQRQRDKIRYNLSN